MPVQVFLPQHGFCSSVSIPVSGVFQYSPIFPILRAVVSSYRSKKNCWFFSLVSFHLLSSGDFQAPYMWNQKLGGHSFHSLHYKSTRTYSLQILARETWWVLRNLTKIWHSPGHPEAPPKLEASLPAQLHRKGGKTDSWGGQMPRTDRCQVFLNDFNWRLKPSKP